VHWLQHVRLALQQWRRSDRNNGGGRIVCTQNATVGEEYRRGWHPEKFNPSDRAGDPILIIGAGPAGMECARVLGERGFEAVHLAEAASEVGGHVNWVSRLPGMRTWRRVVEYREAQLAKMSNVTVLTGKHFNLEDVLEYGAATVIRCGNGRNRYGRDLGP